MPTFPVLDPMQYIGRVKRDDEGKVRNIEVFYPTENVRLTDGDEFITFTTVILLEEPTKQETD